MDKVLRIPTPFKRRLQYFRARVLSLVVWAGAVALVALLWGERAVRVDTPGMVEARQAMVASAQSGALKSVAVDLFDQVAVSTSARARPSWRATRSSPLRIRARCGS